MSVAYHDGPSGKGLGAFVMTFNRPETLRATLAALLDQTQPPEQVLVLDNGGSAAAESVVSSLGDRRVHHVSMGGNLGPAGAAAYGLRELTERGFSWVYWGDDDDPPKTPDTLQRLVEMGTRYGDEAAAVGAVGTRWDWQTGRVVRLPDSALAGVLDVDVIAGSSQLIVATKAVREIGLPNADLFFGFEEPEYCLRLRGAGGRLLIDGDLALQYREEAGRLNLRRRQPLRPRRSYEDIWRQYYSTRNYIFAMRESFQHPELARRETVRAMARILSSWGHGPRYGFRFSHLQSRAVRDGYSGRLGRTVLPAGHG